MLRTLETRPSSELDEPKERECSPIPLFKAAVTQSSLISALGLSPDVPYQDLKRCLSIGTSLSLTDQDGIEWMMQPLQLQEWLLFPPRSRTLLINGNGDANEMFSSTTFLCAMLLESLAHVEPIVSQHFFCSLHTTPRKETALQSSPNPSSLSVQLGRGENSFLTLIHRIISNQLTPRL